MDITEQEFLEGTLPFPQKKNSPKLGVKFNKLTLVGYGFTEDMRGYFYRCDCGVYKQIRSHSQVVSGVFSQCSKCKVVQRNHVRFARFLLKYEDKFPTYPITNPTYEDWHKDELKVLCPKHGEVGTIRKCNFFGRCKTPCGECNEELRVLSRKMDKTSFVERAVALHGDKYDYTDTELLGCKEELSIKCNQCNKVFTQIQDYHLQGSGCNLCTTGGYRKERQGVVYVSAWDGFVKVGITNSTAYARMLTQSKRSNLEGEVLFCSDRVDGCIPPQVEKLITSKFNNRFVSKETFPDGWTETYDPKHLHEILTIVKQFDYNE